MVLFSHPSNDAHEGVHVFQDHESGLRGIVAIHSTHLGPAAGGCRVWNYRSGEEALTDALRLSRGMSYKNALAGLNAGGGKAVILAPPHRFDRRELFEAFGRAVDSLGGRYITAEDVGSTVQDMECVGSQTSHVAGLPPDRPASAGGHPSPWTALGVFLAIKSAVEHRFGRSLDGVRVAIQGLGNVGFNLCRSLHDAGAELIVSDLSRERMLAAKTAFRAHTAPVDSIHLADSDVFAPCAMGGILDARTIAELAAKVVCGAANNQLSEAADGERLRGRGILYCPDYVVNAGGIINVMAEHAGLGAATAENQVRQIPLRLSEIFFRAQAEDKPTNEVADSLARALIGRGEPIG
ncbi:MAG: Leucine dehydrogenase [Rhodospirillales bacterium]|nr:Leucine dehydrogenase [Rhodospirillales bacterium]